MMKWKESYELFELKWAGKKDAEAYQEQMDDVKRLSFEQHNEETFKVSRISQQCH